MRAVRSVLLAGRVRVGETSASSTVTIRNTGTTQLELGKPAITGDARSDWKVAANGCAAALPVGSSCDLGLVSTPSASGVRPAQLEITDSTARGMHHARLTATGATTASAPTNVRVIGTLTGVDVAWDLPTDDGSSEITSFAVHRFVGDQETTFEVPRLSYDPNFRW